MPAELLSLSLACERDRFSLQLDEAVSLEGLTAVFGPSGSGKTSLLRLIAGLDQPDMGRIEAGDTLWLDTEARTSVRPEKRGAGYMFQDARLFSHLNVRGNLVFADRRSRALDTAISFDAVVEATGLPGLLDRSVAGLSGGERQRVALARAILSRPRVLLLDEPLTGLDRAAKREILPYLKHAPARFGLPVIFVSHDIEEVSALADRILVLDAGRVVAHGPAGDVLQTLDLGPLLPDGQSGGFVEAVIVGHDTGLGVTRLDLAGTSLSLPLDQRLETGGSVRLFIDASDVAIAIRKPEGISIRNVIPAKLVEIGATGMSHADLVLRPHSGATLRARVTTASVVELGLEPDMDVFALVKSMSLTGRLGAE